MKNFTPKEIVSILDEHIVGQKEAKKAVAIALRNRWRRMQLDEDIRKEVVPKNILMIGPTGVGKTEIARRLAQLDDSPFYKVDATKFTEVGYVGRDVEQIIKDLVQISVNNAKNSHKAKYIAKAEKLAEDRILEQLIGKNPGEETRKTFTTRLRKGELDSAQITLQVKDRKNDNPFGHIQGVEIAAIGNIFNQPKKMKTINTTVGDAKKILLDEELDNLVNEDDYTTQAIFDVENKGIVFIDEIDKIISSDDGIRRGDVSREGVQRDLLSLIEGTQVNTKYGIINTDHILFIASGAFHLANPSNLLPELQGRLPIRVKLESLTKEDFKRILREPKHNIVFQYQKLLDVEGLELSFSDGAIDKIAEISMTLNQQVENTGARRLYTVIEKVLETINFDASDLENKTVVITEDYVVEKINLLDGSSELGEDRFSKFIL